MSSPVKGKYEGEVLMKFAEIALLPVLKVKQQREIQSAMYDIVIP
jgi:hypothetical protein